MSKYVGQFASIQKNKQYTVEIITNGSLSPEVSIYLGTSPFVSQQSTDGETIYSPLKTSSATVEIVSNPMYFDIYSNTAKQNTVKLLDSSNNVVWCGYTSPNTYSSAFDRDIETYSVECVDPLGVLQYYDYECIDPSTKNFRSFTAIINKVLSKAGLLTNWYFSTNTKISGQSGQINDLCTISEANFFDEDEEPMKMNEVLTEICKFCGVSAVVRGTSVFFIDYDAIKNNVNSYARYTVGNNTMTGTITLSDDFTIDASSFMESGTTITLDNTYSKVTVKDSLYKVDSIIPSLYDEKSLCNIKGYPWKDPSNNDDYSIN